MEEMVTITNIPRENVVEKTEITVIRPY